MREYRDIGSSRPVLMIHDPKVTVAPPDMGKNADYGAWSREQGTGEVLEDWFGFHKCTDKMPRNGAFDYGVNWRYNVWPAFGDRFLTSRSASQEARADLFHPIPARAFVEAPAEEITSPLGELNVWGFGVPLLSAPPEKVIGRGSDPLAALMEGAIHAVGSTGIPGTWSESALRRRKSRWDPAKFCRVGPWQPDTGFAWSPDKMPVEPQPGHCLRLFWDAEKKRYLCGLVKV